MLHYTYLATPDDFESFGPNDFARYCYIGLFDFGPRAEDIDDHELSLILVSVANFMREKCLFVSRGQHTELAGTNGFLQSVYRVFENPESLSSYFAMATICRGVDDRLLLSPVYLPLELTSEGDSRYPFYTAVNNGLEGLKISLTNAALEEMLPPPRSPKGHSSKTPNSYLIRRLRQAIGTHEEIEDMVKSIPGMSDLYAPPKRTIQRAEQFCTMNQSTLRRFSDYFEVSLNRLILDRVVLNQEVIVGLREECGLSAEELAEECGLKSPHFFHQLEVATWVPAAVLRFVHRVFDELQDDELKVRELIDLGKTERLAPD